MRCIICHDDYSEQIFCHTVLEKYEVAYYKCKCCGAVFTEQPFWLEEAYGEESGIADIDTGIMLRNIGYSKILNAVLSDFFPNIERALDYGGGHGIFTRLMRDLGWNYFWEDKYCNNIFARMFEWSGQKVEFLSAFEVCEHLVDPIETFKNWFSIAENVLISTQVVSAYEKEGMNWWYFSFESGQHIVFYDINTLEYIAKLFHKNCIQVNNNLFLFSSKFISSKKMKRCISQRNINKAYLQSSKNSKVISDMQYIKGLHSV